MLIRRSNPQAIHESEVTEESLFLTRRQLVLAGAAAIAAPVAQAGLFDLFSSKDTSASLPTGKTLVAQASNYQVNEPVTSWQDVTHYNNFYEFSTDKTEVADLAKNFQPEPWLLDIKGAVKNAGRYDLDDLAKRFTLQERIYRLRCVEGWSMVIPWIGFPLADLIRWLEPQNNAKYVVFRSLVDPKQMPGQKQGFGSLDWPYQEALRLDEAMNPLSLMVMGLYGRVLPGQNGAPLRLAVPWKYGFKSAKSIVSIEFVEHQPITTWAKMAPNEYGFYANVNPQVDHPRWSQSHERRIGGSLGGQRMPTQLFNGYAEQVATLYTGLDLTRNF